MPVEIIARPHPLRSDAYRAEAAPGATLAELLGDAPETVRAQVNGEIWPRERWGEPLPEGLVTIYATPQGDNVLRMVAMIAVTAAVGAIVGPAGLALTGWTKAAVSAGLNVAGALAVNALIPPKLPEVPQGTAATVAKSLTGTRNQPNPYGVVPRVYGAPRWFPPIVASPVTEIAGNDQYLRMLVCLGYGPLQVDGHTVGQGYPRLTQKTVLAPGIIQIGETDLGQFADVEWEIGTADQLTLYTQDIHEEAVNAALDLQSENGKKGTYPDDVWAVRTTAPNTREISLDLTWPAGLYSYGNRLNSEHPFVYFQIEYRPVGGGSWITVPGNSPAEYERVWVCDAGGHCYWDAGALLVPAGRYHVYNGPHQQTYRANVRWSVPVGQYDVRVTRVKTAINDRDIIQSDAVWTALRSVQAGRPYTGDHVLMALRIRATDQLDGVVDQLSIRTQSVLRVWNGAGFTREPTSNPAWAYLDAMTGSQVGRPIPDSRIDLEAIRDWAQWCDAQGLRYHWVHDGAETVLERLRAIATAGQASYSQQDGRFGVVRDDPTAPLVQVISPRNATSFESSRQYRSLPHALRVKYIDPNTWSDAERIVYRDGYSAANATVFEDLQTQGVASAEEAWHHGQYYFRQAILRPETYRVSMDWENLALVRGNRARLAYDAILVGLGWGRVKRVVTDGNGDAVELVLDEQVIIELDTTYGVRIRRQDGTQATVQVLPNTVGYTDTLPLVEPVPSVAVGDLVLYGEHGRESIDCKVIKIEPGPDFTAALTLVDAATDIYDYGRPPKYDPGITHQPAIDRVQPPPPIIERLISDSSTLVIAGDGQFVPGVRVLWRPRSSTVPIDRVEARFGIHEDWTHVSVVPGESLHVPVQEAARITTQLRVRSVYGVWSSWSGASYFTPIGEAARPSDVSGFSLAGIGDQAQLSWNPVRDVDVLHGGYVAIYHSPSLHATISEATPLARLPGTATTATVPLLYGTYFALAEDAGGRGSVNPARIVSTAARIVRLNVVETVAEGPQFLGVRSNVMAIDGVLKLDSARTIDEVDDIDSAGPIDVLGGLALEGEYRLEERADLGAVYTCRLTAAINTTAYLADDFVDGREYIDAWGDVDGSAYVTGPRIDLYVRTTPDDPANAPVWTEWQPFVVGDYTARALEFRLVISTNDPNRQIHVSSLMVSIDVPDRMESGESVLVPPEGLTVSFDSAFWAKPAIGVTAEDLGPGERVVVDSKSRNGFRVQILDANEQGVARTMDWIAKGYGEEMTDAA